MSLELILQVFRRLTCVTFSLLRHPLDQVFRSCLTREESLTPSYLCMLTHRLAEVCSSQGNRATDEGRFEALINTSFLSFDNMFLQRFNVNITHSKVNYKGKKHQQHVIGTLFGLLHRYRVNLRESDLQPIGWG